MNPHSSNRGPDSSTPPAGSPSRHLLVADDHDIVRHGLRLLLQQTLVNLEIEEARSGEEVLQQCRRRSWDLVLLDLTMPGRSGLELLSDLRREFPGTPVLIMSASPEEEFALRALREGASGYLDKRTMAAEVVVALERVWSGGRYVSARLASALADQLGGAARPLHAALSAREFQVLRRIAAGHTIKEIAADLGLSDKTVGTYRTRISEKLKLGTNVELTRYALQHRLVE